MSWPVILQHISVVAAMCVAVVALHFRNMPRSLYFTYFALCVFLLNLGYLYEITAPSQDAAVMACRLQYFGAAFNGIFFYLFCRDYCNVSIRKRWRIAVLLAWPIVCLLMVNMWPATRLFYTDLTYTTQGLVHHLEVTPGPFYWANTLFNVVLALVGFAIVLRYFRSGADGRRNAIVFALSTLVSMLGLAFKTIGLLPGYDPLPLGLTATIIILALYIYRVRQREWISLGRGAVVENMADAFILVDTRGRYQDANPVALRYFPGLARLSPGDDLARVPEIPPALSACEGTVHEFTLKQEDGSTIYLRASITPLHVGNKTMGASILIYDDTTNRNLMRELHELATHDTLTCLLNRGTFFLYATRDFALYMRRHESASLLMIDLDNFKQVNDEHGHMMGDRVLATISDILVTRLRHTDICGRYGGEELAVWLPGAAAEGGAMIADVLRRAVEQTVFDDGKGPFNITISIGVAGIDFVRHRRFDDMVQEADEALYMAKNQGRNRVCIYKYTGPPVQQADTADEAPGEQTSIANFS